MRIQRTDRLLGSGAGASVFEGIDLDNDTVVAVKVIEVGAGSGDHAVTTTGVSLVGMESILTSSDACGPRSSADVTVAEQNADRVAAEIELMSKANHPNIVKYLGSIVEGSTVNIIMELVPGGSLGELIRQQGPLPEASIRGFANDILSGVQYLHDVCRISHRDLKSDNVLLTTAGKCKVTDFGVSRSLAQGTLMTTFVGTACYMAPEVGDEEGYTAKADVWSIGCIVYEMVVGAPPFSNLNPVAAMYQVQVGGLLPEVPPDQARLVSIECLDFLSCCLQRDPSKRPSVSELLVHPWINKLTLEGCIGRGHSFEDEHTFGRVGRQLAGLSPTSPSAAKPGGEGMEEEEEDKEDTDFFPGLEKDSDKDNFVLPSCDRCKALPALFQCDYCASLEAGLPYRLCIGCWTEIHRHHRSQLHRKMPLLVSATVDTAGRSTAAEIDDSANQEPINAMTENAETPPSRKKKHSFSSSSRLVPRHNDGIGRAHTFTAGEDGSLFNQGTGDFLDIFPSEMCQWSCGKCNTINDGAEERCVICDHEQ